MRSRFLHSLIQLFLILCFVGSCIKPDVFPNEPEITNVRVGQTTYSTGASGMADSVYLYIEFTDGDGDLGQSADDPSSNLFLYDERSDTSTAYRIPEITPQGSEKGIFGEFEVLIASVWCYPISGGAITPDSEFPDTDTLIYRVQIKDRANNLSNIVYSEPIIILCNN